MPVRPALPGERDVLAALGRVLDSGDFDASARSRGFIRFVVEETLAGRQEGLTQTAIAVAVFGRREGFDPTVDPIVRIQAGRLRRSLERYYLLSGANDPVRIEVPRGSYVPQWRWNDAVGTPRPPATGADAGTKDRGGWPTVLLVPRVGQERPAGPGAPVLQFLDHLAVELDRYRDVRVVLAPDLGGPTLPKEPRFTLTAQTSEDRGWRRAAVHLLDNRGGSQLWAEEYREAPPGGGDFWRETARVVAARVGSEQGLVAQSLAGQGPAPDLEETTYRAIVLSYRFLLTRDPAEFVPALHALGRAVAADPECALAWCQLARLHVVNHAFEVAAAETSIEQGLALAQRSVRLDPSGPRTRTCLAFALLVKGETAAAAAEVDTALSTNPETWVYLDALGWVLALAGEWDRGVGLVRTAVARNPHHLPFAHFALWADHLRRGEIEEAHQSALRFGDGAFFWRSVMRGACLGILRRPEDARDEIAELLRRKPDFARRGRTLVGRILKQEPLRARVAEGLARAGLPLE